MARSRRQSRCCCAPEKMSASLRSCSIAKNGHSEKEGKRRECPEAMRDLAMSVSHLERERELNTHRTFLVSPSSVQHFSPLLRFDLIRKQEATALATASVSFCLCCRICISVAAAAAASSLSQCCQIGRDSDRIDVSPLRLQTELLSALSAEYSPPLAHSAIRISIKKQNIIASK